MTRGMYHDIPLFERATCGVHFTSARTAQVSSRSVWHVIFGSLPLLFLSSAPLAPVLYYDYRKLHKITYPHKIPHTPQNTTPCDNFGCIFETIDLSPGLHKIPHPGDNFSYAAYIPEGPPFLPPGVLERLSSVCGGNTPCEDLQEYQH